MDKPIQQELESWKECLLLIENVSDGHPRIVPETVERLRQISDPVRCISFNGPYRSGKSHLLNLLISTVFKKDNVFPVGNTVQAMTKGMWIWAGRHPLPDDSGSWIIFMDTEGLGDVQKGDNLNDLQSFILSLLISSTFIYNSRGTIDYQALEKLHYVSTVAEKIRLRSDSAEDEEELGHDLVFPSFVWIVRDFHLGKSVDGKELTDDGYLENALRTKHDASNVSQLSVKRCLKEYFPSRRCFTLPRLVAVEAGKGPDIDPQTLLSPLVHCILTSPLKTYEGSKITGKVLGRLAEAFVPAVLAIEEVSQPRICVQDIMTHVVESENSKVLARCFEDYRASLNREAAEVHEVTELYRIHLDLLNQANMSYMSSAVSPIHSHYPQLTEKIQKEFEELCARKARELEAALADLWAKTKADVIGESDTYIGVGGYERFKKKVHKLKAICEAERTYQGLVGRSFLTTKLAELEGSEGKLIRAADKAMTELLRSQEERRLEDERKLEEARVATAAKKVEKELARKVTECEEVASTTMKRDVDEIRETRKSVLNERIVKMEREAADLKGSGLEEEEENRNDRKEKYMQMVKATDAEADTIWSKAGAAAGTLLSAAANTILEKCEPPAIVKSVFSGIGSITGFW